MAAVQRQNRTPPLKRIIRDHLNSRGRPIFRVYQQSRYTMFKHCICISVTVFKMYILFSQKFIRTFHHKGFLEFLDLTAHVQTVSYKVTSDNITYVFNATFETEN